MTVLSRGQSPKHYHVMPAKQLVYKAMVAMPALLLAGIGAKARIEFDPYEFVTPTPKQNAAILAYQDVVRETECINLDASDDQNMPMARKVALQWIEGAKTGKLVPLVPVSYDDTSRDGVKAEIAQQNEGLASLILYNANLESNAGQYAKAAYDAKLGMQVVQILKYSDYPAVMESSLYERRGLRVVLDALPHLSAGQKAELMDNFSSLKPRSDKLQQVAELERFMFIDYLRRMGIDATRIESIRPFETKTVELPTEQFRGSLLASARDDTLPETQQLEELAKQGEDEVMHLYNQALTASASHS